MCTLSNYSIIGIMKHLGGVCYGNETNKTHFLRSIGFGNGIVKFESCSFCGKQQFFARNRYTRRSVFGIWSWTTKRIGRQKWGYVKLTADIDLSQAESGGKVDSWADYYINNFSGTIDGDGHRIYNAGANSTLIANFGGGELKNFTFELSGQPATLVWNAYTAGIEYNYTDINISGSIIIPATITMKMHWSFMRAVIQL